MTPDASVGRMTIRFRLGLAVALALIPVLLLGGAQSYNEFRRDAQIRSARLVEAADRGGGRARGRVQAATAITEAVAPLTVGATCGAPLAELVGKQLGYENAIRYNGDGSVRCAVVPVQPIGGGWFQKLKDGDSQALARAPAGAYGPEAGLVVATRVSDPGGAFDGALAIVIKLSNLQPGVADPALPSGSQVALLDNDGKILSASDAKAFAAPPEGWQAATTNKGWFSFDGKDATGVTRTHAIAPMVDNEVYAILSAPKPGIAGFARLNPVATILFPLLAWVLAWATVWIATDRVVIRWLSYLDRIASFYAKGRFSVRPVQAEAAPAEIRSLAHTLDAMAEAIVARDLSLRESIAHKDALMREIHHRVKNNLQVITSLLNMQQRSLTDPAARAAMSDTRQRITALALIYRALYQSPDLSRVDVRQFLEELIAQMVTGEGGRPSAIRTELEADDLEIDPDKLAPLALFAVEAVTAARKHALEGAEGLIRVKFSVGPEQIVLEIVDDGEDDQTTPEAGVGRTLMTAFARQLRGQVTFEPDVSGEHVVRLTFPRPEAAPATGPASPEADSTKSSNRKASGNQAAA